MLKPWMCFLVLVALTSCANNRNVTLTQETQPINQKHSAAVVVGINHYSSPQSGLWNLSYAAEDAQLLSKTLQTKGYQVQRLLDNQASKKRILDEIRNAGSSMQNVKGIFVFSFSGHAVTFQNENYLVTSDSTADNLAITLSVSEVVNAIKSAGVERMVLFLDGYRANPNSKLAEQRFANSGFLNRSYGENVRVLYSTAWGGTSWESRELEHSVFSNFLSQGLNGEATKNDLITFSSLAQYVRKEVSYWTFNKNPDHVQKPVKSKNSEDYDDFVLTPTYNDEAIGLAFYLDSSSFIGYIRHLLRRKENAIDTSTSTSPQLIIRSSRLFAGPKDYPPSDFAAYGTVTFKSRAVKEDLERHRLFCKAYIATLPHSSELVEKVAIKEQMATVWPVEHSSVAHTLNRAKRSSELCHEAIQYYDLATSLQSIRDAELTGENLNGRGPYLLAWSPAMTKGQSDALVLVVDMSDVRTYKEAVTVFNHWRKSIEQNPSTWKKGFDLKKIRMGVRQWADKTGLTLSHAFKQLFE